jgi:hypothetical protein
VSSKDNHPKDWHEGNANLEEPIGMLINGYICERLQEDSFASEGSRWSSGPADWFVIGGRWSGDLSQKELGLDYKGLQAELKQRGYPKTEIPKQDVSLFEDKGMVSSNFVKTLTEELNLLWTDLGGDEVHPWVRDSYANFGYPDDSKKLTKNLYQNLFSPEEYSCEEKWIDIDAYSDLDKWSDLEEYIDKNSMWLTVIDYHC